uniref:Ocs element-binding factor 1 n=1 Tax=Anthurium amnicola TaxID=1678845 RepID=A0A1D1Y748_9ARAE
MYPGEVASLSYLVPVNPAPYPTHFGMAENSIPSFHFSRFFTPSASAAYLNTVLPSHELTPQDSSLSNNSNSDEGDEHQRSLIEERKRRRMISNRESARRSRMRKQRHLDELQWQVANLRSVNRRLIDELNQTIGDRDHMLQENSHLRDEASSLHQRLKNMQVDETCNGLQDPKEGEEDEPCDASTNQPATASSSE